MFLLKDTMQWRWWGSNPLPLGLESSTLPLSHCAPSTLCRLMDSLVWYNKLGIVHCTYLGESGYFFKKNIEFFCLKIFIYLYKQCRPWWNAASCCISSGSSLFAKVLIKRFTGIQMVNGGFWPTVKPVLNSHSKIDKTKVLKTDYRLMQVKSIAECSCNTLMSWNQILVFFLSGRLRQVILYVISNQIVWSDSFDVSYLLEYRQRILTGVLVVHGAI